MRRRRNRFIRHDSPTRPMGQPVSALESQIEGLLSAELRSLEEWFTSQTDGRERVRWVLRDSMDELLDGQRTGRWCYQQLSKTEKTHLGTVVEANLTKEFEIPDGVHLDWRVSNQELDCKFSKDLGGWEMPMEMYVCADHGDRSGLADQAALLVWMCDDARQWAAGLIRITDEMLRWKVDKSTNARMRAYNRDNKRRLATESVADIYWLWGGLQTDLPENTLLGLTSETRDAILGHGSGQTRVNALFREVQRVVIGRPTILTVGQQDDAPKRVRDARTQLRPEGVVILGHQDSHPQIARALGLPVPYKGEWISVRLAPVGLSDPRPKVFIQGQHWAVATESEPSEGAPAIPKRLPT